MELKSHWIHPSELDDYLKKYEDKIKFVSICTSYVIGFRPNTILLVIDHGKDESDSEVSLGKKKKNA